MNRTNCRWSKDLEAEATELTEAIEKIKTQIETVAVDYTNEQNELKQAEQEKRNIEKKKSDIIKELDEEEHTYDVILLLYFDIHKYIDSIH